MKKFLAAAVLASAPIAVFAQSRSTYTDFMYDDRADRGQRSALVPGSMEYALPADGRRPRRNGDTVGYVDVLPGMSMLDGYDVKKGGDALGSEEALGGLALEKTRSFGWGFKVGFDAIGSILGVEIDFEGSNHDGTKPDSQQPSFDPLLGEVIGNEYYEDRLSSGAKKGKNDEGEDYWFYYDAEGEEHELKLFPDAQQKLRNYEQNLKFFQGGLNLVLNFGGSAGRINPFVGVGGGFARLRLQHKGTVITRTQDEVEAYSCVGDPDSDMASCGITYETVGAPGSVPVLWCADGSIADENGDCSDGSTAQTGSLEGCTVGDVFSPGPCATIDVGNGGTWSSVGNLPSFDQSRYQFPVEEGVNVGYMRALAGIAIKVGPYANIVAQGSYTRYNDPGFETMTLENLVRKQGSIGLRMNF